MCNLTEIAKNLAWRSRLLGDTTRVNFLDMAEERLKEQTDRLPSGSGLDSGVRLDLEKSTPTKLIFHTSFHHMNEGGMYDGWTDHSIKVTPTFGGFDLSISGKNRNQIKEYLYDLFNDVFTV